MHRKPSPPSQSGTLFGIQEDGPTSIIRWLKDHCNKYANEKQGASLSTQICLRMKVRANVLIAQSRKNPDIETTAEFIDVEAAVPRVCQLTAQKTAGLNNNKQ